MTNESDARMRGDGTMRILSSDFPNGGNQGDSKPEPAKTEPAKTEPKKD